MISQQLTMKVVEKIAMAKDVVMLELASADGEPLPAFTAGAHINVRLPTGVTRPYSLCGNPAQHERYRLGVSLARNSRGGSRTVHDLLQVGDVIEGSLPVNHFPLNEGAPSSVLVGGGIGITPLLAMAYRLQSMDADWHLHLCARSKDHCAFMTELTHPRFAPFVTLHFDGGDAARHLDFASLIRSAREGSHLYTCGPDGFMKQVLSEARHAQWTEERLHFESFKPEFEKSAGNHAFELQLARSRKTLLVPPDKTALQIMLDAGVEVPFSCESGVCATCVTRVLDGLPDHCDQCLTEKERTQSFTPCCSRALTPYLSIDI